ncbi:tRNA-dihydrouridine synthase C [Pseudoalteromonas ulvae UL12]|uniref:tRNA-dihydrouridine synthase n=1 Tax=Pseudoalteromonas ulvae TaxID=107327 RepID=UPI00186B7F8D|nr:tRNA-dihydrouridine synthase [Pseudoalteromonas ulvae]MBE0363481.1 tRNA-dihydrouridine synthase C [Pseudoalteromonas ulvae UL12]MBE0363484.1 tRNA-dihydrouridine synthase C [Pseudoalteromonas ulvae UL12]
MKLILAPMEGVVDFQMRQFLTDLGGFDLCVTEFIRIVDQLLPPRVFFRYCPELNQHGKTRSGTSVRIQLLGQEPHWLAQNAVRAIELGSHGIDLNFGCPAKAVNKSRGGAVLLKDPEIIYAIVKAVRDAVDPAHEVTAKVRLGFDDDSLSQEIFDAVASANASSIAIHARTKKDGYRPPAYWEKILPLKAQKSLPVVANGEVWSVDDYQRCKLRSGCTDVMLGRGALAQPDLAKEIAMSNINQPYKPLEWKDLLLQILESGMHSCGDKNSQYFASRTKQWLAYLKLNYPEAVTLFEDIKRLHENAAVLEIVKGHANIG